MKPTDIDNFQRLMLIVSFLMPLLPVFMIKVANANTSIKLQITVLVGFFTSINTKNGMINFIQ